MQLSIQIFVVMATLLLMFMSLIWSKANAPNVLIKMVFMIATLYGILLTYELILRPIFI